MTCPKRCKWCNPKNPLYISYHDSEWGKGHTDDAYLYEMLILECFQAGLSFECVLNKRENFRSAFDGFDRWKVSAYGQEKIEALLQNKGIIRHEKKIRATIANSAVFEKIVGQYGSFYAYLKTFTGDKVLYEADKSQNAISDALSKDLKKRGMRFVGSTVMYAYLQAVGLIDSHDRQCYLYKEQEND
jgi:DNA-3-methyladenine glycosylase I